MDKHSAMVYCISYLSLSMDWRVCGCWSSDRRNRTSYIFLINDKLDLKFSLSIGRGRKSSIRLHPRGHVNQQELVFFSLSKMKDQDELYKILNEVFKNMEEKIKPV